jgi:hypothetical protein
VYPEDAIAIELGVLMDTPPSKTAYRSSGVTPGLHMASIGPWEMLPEAGVVTWQERFAGEFPKVAARDALLFSG